MKALRNVHLRILISVFLVLLLSTGCGTGGTTQTDNSETTTKGAQDTSQQSEQTSAPVVQEKPVKIITCNTNGYTQEDYDRMKTLIEEKSGVNFEVIVVESHEDFETKVNLALSSNEDIDVISFFGGNGIYPGLIARGALMPINNVLEQYGKNILKVFEEEAWYAVKDMNGNIYGIPSKDPVVGGLVAIRKDWREKLGMGTITTMDEFESYLAGVRDGDLDGNEKKDTIPLTVSSNDYYYTRYALSSFFTDIRGGEGNYLDAEGNITPIYMHPNYKDFLKAMARWTKEGLLFSEILTTQKAQTKDLITNNRIGAIAEWYSFHINPLLELKKTVPEAEYEYISPKTISGKESKLNVESSYAQAVSIVSYSKNAEFAIKLFDWQMSSQENYNFPQVGVEGVDYSFVDKTKGIIKKINEEKIKASINFLNYAPLNYRYEADPATQMFYNAQDWNLSYGKLWEIPDWFITYDLKGTPLEATQADAETLIEETISKIITGAVSVDEWDKAIAAYKEKYGNAYVKLATEQYNKYSK